MRIALISDIHGHATALDAVLKDIARQNVDQIVCLGDVATIGPQPREVVTRLRRLGCLFVMGNHDAALLNPAAARQYHIADVLWPSLAWCAEQLDAEDMAFLASFQPTIEVSLGANTTLACFHGSPRSPVELVLATTPAADLEAFFAGQTAAVLAGGHSHIQMLRQHLGQLIINPGSVGHPFMRPASPGIVPTLFRWAEYAIVQCVDECLSVELRRVPFDIEAFFAIVAASSLPIKDMFLQQYATQGMKDKR
ncbi:MAG TPA: metallophosphoesterase family protein [Herpetosiphonaceae bacterium]|nr:metallophosphoesterase family protein [Herpetosiphonaceae bacterium]